MNLKLPLIFSLGFFLIGGALLVAAYTQWRKAEASLGWPTVMGTVTQAQLDEVRTIDGGTRYTPTLVFMYVAEGDPHESDQYTFGRRETLDGAYAQALVKRYQDEPQAPVHYNPENPAEAVLLPGDASGLKGRAATGLVFLVLGVVVLVRAAHRTVRLGA